MKTKPIPTKEELEKVFYYDHLGGVLYRLSTGKTAQLLNKSKVKDREGYRTYLTYFNSKPWATHRLICVLTGKYEPEDMQDMVVDHINRNPQDNHYNNLHVISSRENMNNKVMPSTGIFSNIAGIRYHKRDMLFEVYYGKKYQKGFKNLFDAACFRKKFELEMGIDYEYAS